jgi:DNA-binding transcriptional MerR regulator
MTTIQPGVTGRRPPARRSGRRLLPTKQVADRYGVTSRTVERWRRNPALNFPAALNINGRNYQDEDEVDAFDERQAARTR